MHGGKYNWNGIEQRIEKQTFIEAGKCNTAYVPDTNSDF